MDYSPERQFAKRKKYREYLQVNQASDANGSRLLPVKLMLVNVTRVRLEKVLCDLSN